MKLTRTIFALALLVAVTHDAFSQTKLIEKITKKPGELVIAYEKYQLSNGMTLLIHEDHSDPIVYVDVTYHVGSAREQEGRSGFAHFFEHMMFQGSEHVGDEQHFKIVTEAGGTLNGTTNRDRTNYFEVLPSNQLETAFWLESDRMGFLLDSVTQQKFEVQRATVKNERGQNYDNKPYGIVYEKICAALYPPSHPYSWLTIGYIEDLNRVDVNDLKKFFLRWYGPNNATLTVAGDVNPQAVIKLAEKYFGSIPKGPEVKAQVVAPIVLKEDRYISYEDNIRAPQISFSFPTVAARHTDEPALDILSDILGGSKSSIFYQNFVKSQLAQMANVGHPTDELAGMLNITIRTFPDKSLAQMDSLVRLSLLQFEQRGVTDDDISKFIAQYESRLVSSLASVQGKGARLAEYQTYTNNPNYLKNELEAYKKVSKQDIIRVYNQYIKNKYAVVLSVCPKGKSSLASKPDNYTFPSRNVNATEGDEYKNLKYVKGNDSFDRSKQPIITGTPIVIPPDYWKQNFDNGLKIIGVSTDEIPTVTLQLSIEAGHRYESISKSGVSQLLSSLLNESTINYTAEAIAEKLERLGSTVSIMNNGQDIVLYISTLTKNLDATLAIAEEILFRPKFDKTEFERIKKQRIEAIENQSTQATTIANNVFTKLIHGNNHIMSIPAMGTKESVEKITLENVIDYYNTMITPSISSLVIVGDVKQENIISKLSFLKNWKAKPVKHEAEPKVPSIDKTRIYFVNKDKAPQSEIRIGYMAMPYDATGDYYKSVIMNYPLGGSFNSRINLNLREKHGFTYGARAVFTGNQFAGPYVASAGVRANATDSSIVEFMNEIKNYAENGIKKEELQFTQSSMTQSEALKYETPMQKAGFVKRILDYNLSKNYTNDQNKFLNSITTSEINEWAKKQLPYNNMVILIVGDKALTWDAVNKLGYDVIELDIYGNLLVKSEKATEENKTTPEQKTYPPGMEPAKKVYKDAKNKP